MQGRKTALRYARTLTDELTGKYGEAAGFRTALSSMISMLEVPRSEDDYRYWAACYAAVIRLGKKRAIIDPMPIC